jgi:putative DNA primase/helicase
VAEEWPEPSSLTVHRQADPYPLEALAGTIGAAVREVVNYVQCPVALGACSALAVVSTVAQGLVDVRRAGKLEGPTSLYLLAIADSGERKTTVDGFFSKPVALWEAQQAEAAKPDLRRYEAEQATWEAKKGGLLAAVKRASKDGTPTLELEKKVASLETEKPYPPNPPRLLFGDSTPEALAHRLAHGWPVGGVLSSEAGLVFGGHAMGKDSAMRNMSMLNSLWGAEPLTFDRRSVPSFTVRGARLTMGLAVQSETVRAFLDSSKGLARGIGWLARFLIAWPESTQGDRLYKDPPETWPNLEKFHRRLGALLDHPLAFNDQGELEPEPLELSPEAKAEWIAFHDEVEAELRPGRDMAETNDVASKAADNAARLAALFHLFENGPGGTIGLDHMKAAASLASWHLYEARRFMGAIALPLELNNTATLDVWLLEYCQQNRAAEVSTRDIQQLGPSCTRKSRTLDPALEELAKAGRVRVVVDGRRKLVKVNPALLRY